MLILRMRVWRGGAVIEAMERGIASTSQHNGVEALK